MKNVYLKGNLYVDGDIIAFSEKNADDFFVDGNLLASGDVIAFSKKPNKNLGTHIKGNLRCAGDVVCYKI